MIDAAFLISGFATLFVVMDPIGLVPLFLALTMGQSGAARRKIALRACTIAAVILTLFGLTGDSILAFIGISMPAFRIAGGILLFLTALDMLFDWRKTPGPDNRPDHSDPSIFPLATPLMAGPGAIAAMILLIGQGGNDFVATSAVIGLMLVVLMITFLLLNVATTLERALGPIGTLVITRLLGMLLAALAVQFVLDGLRQAGVF
jgi:multiple antibiotic resistance protein